MQDSIRAVSAPASRAPNLAEQLRNAITEGVYLPGDKLTERELCERFGVSRASVREALRQLDGEGLLAVAPHRGPIVRPMDAAQFAQLHELRATLQQLGARLFAQRGTMPQISQFERCIDDFEQALLSRVVPAIRASKHLLFEAFIQGASNEPLGASLRQVNCRLGFLWSSSLNHPTRPQESIEEWRRMAEAIRLRDPEAAQAAMVLQNQRARAIGLHALEQFGRRA